MKPLVLEAQEGKEKSFFHSSELSSSAGVTGGQLGATESAMVMHSVAVFLSIKAVHNFKKKIGLKLQLLGGTQSTNH